MIVNQQVRCNANPSSVVILPALLAISAILCATRARAQDPGADAAMQAAQIAAQQMQQMQQTVQQQIIQQQMQNTMQDTSTPPARRPQVPSFPRADKPLFSLRHGKYAVGTSVTIQDSVPKAMILYTTDGTAPTLNSKIYTGPIVLASTVRLRAIALSTTHTPSPVASAKYVVQ